MKTLKSAVLARILAVIVTVAMIGTLSIPVLACFGAEAPSPTREIGEVSCNKTFLCGIFTGSMILLIIALLIGITYLRLYFVSF